MTSVFPARARSTLSDMPTLLQALREAAATMLAALATLVCTWIIAPGPGSAVLAVVLTVSLSRSQLDRNVRGRLEAAFVLPLVGLAALGVAMLLRFAPWFGAAAFVAGMFVSIWLRRFGPMARRAGSLIALPFVTLLTVPHVHVTQGGKLPAVLVPIIVALLALFWVAVCHLLVRRMPWRTSAEDAEPAASTPVRQNRSGLQASTRMAVQMAIALAASFVAGYVFFSERWAWIVLTAFVVNSGNRGRLDVVYKSGLRVLGAAVGTVFALMFSLQTGFVGTHSGTLILVAVFLGIWLRPFNYAWWALFITIALALLQGFDGHQPSAILLLRLEEILIGAIIGITAAWLVVPVRSTDVLRLRMAHALAALSEAFDPQVSTRSIARFDDALSQLDQMAPPFRATRLLTRRIHALQPADWIDALHACRTPARGLITQGVAPGEVRRAIGTARKAVKEPETLLPALKYLQGVLQGNAD
ncbi:FUSC family protein [Dyella monticola]|nr:FUSC family protein [Dyella monticola]